MRKSVMAVALGALIFAAGSPAHAGVYADDLSKCLVRSATDADQTDLAVWVFSALSAHPAAKSYSSLTDANRLAITKKAAGLFQRLVLVDCRKESVASLKYEGQGSMEGAFNVLGQVAMRGLMSDPQVGVVMGAMNEQMDLEKFEVLLKEAGLQPSPPPAAPK